MSRSFVVRWKDQLEHTWHLLDNNDNMHSVTYNQDLVNPTILVEWIEFKDFYGLTRNHQVTMTHFGQSVFFLPIFKSSYEPKTYPKWHSLYHQIPNSVTFKVLSNEYKTTCSSLVSKSALYKSTYVNFRMCWISCTHLWKLQDSLIYIWKRLQNAWLFIIIGGSLQKLTMDGRLLHN